MKDTVIFLFLLVFVAASGATAQSPPSDHYLRDIYRALSCNRAVQDQAEQQITNRREAQYKESQSWSKTQKFIDSWGALVREYNEKGAFNVKKAKQVSKAFHDLEKSEGWPKDGK